MFGSTFGDGKIDFIGRIDFASRIDSNLKLEFGTSVSTLIFGHKFSRNQF
jgi:hypothetical protein